MSESGIPDIAKQDQNRLIAFMKQLKLLAAQYEIHAFLCYLAPRSSHTDIPVVGKISGGCEKCTALAHAAHLIKMEDYEKTDLLYATEFLTRHADIFGETTQGEFPPEVEDISKMN
jgi:hypothetical protein